VDPTAIRNNVGYLRDKLPASEVAAFERDAQMCFTPGQLARLRQAYLDGRRSKGEWVPSELDKKNADYEAKKR
jgi:hypothetical protein